MAKLGRPKSIAGNLHDSPRSLRLVRFFKRKPLPVRLVGLTEDEDEVVCAVAEQPKHGTWVDCVSVLKHCVRVTAYDAQDRMLRVIELDPNDPELRREDEMREAEDAVRAGASSATPGSLPVISVDIPKLVDNIARNMREVASEAASQNSNAFKEGFTALVQCVNVCLNLLVSVEQRLAERDAADAEREREAEAAQLPGMSAKDQLALMALQKAMAGGAPPNGAPNGGGGFDMSQLLALAQSFMAKQGGGEGDAP